MMGSFWQGQLERAAHAVSRGKVPDPADVIGLHAADVDARAAQLSRIRILQAHAAASLTLRERARFTEAALVRARAHARRDKAPAPDPRRYREHDAEARDAEEALAELLRRLPAEVSAVYVEADDALNGALGEIERLERQLVKVPDQRVRLAAARKQVARETGIGPLRRDAELAAIDIELAGLPSEKALAAELKTARAGLPALERARAAALRSLCSWTPCPK